MLWCFLGCFAFLLATNWRLACVMGDMIKILSYSERESLASMIGELVQESLADGVHPADLSAALTVAASRIGRQHAPTRGSPSRSS
jgi:hypothetical protein